MSSSKVRVNRNGCVKAGPYLPTGDTDWHCRTHKVDLVYLGLGPHRDQRWACPVAERKLIEQNVGRIMKMRGLA